MRWFISWCQICNRNPTMCWKRHPTCSLIEYFKPKHTQTGEMGCRFMWGSRGIDLGLERRGCRDDDTDRPFFPAPTICHVRWSSVAKNEHLQLPIARLRLAKRRHTKSKYLDAVFFTFFMLLYPTLRLFLSSVASPYRTLSLVLEGRVRAVICQFFFWKNVQLKASTNFFQDISWLV